MNVKPLVTVYMPTYNRLELLKRAVKSVLDQDYSNIELIVVDDGSTDGTVEYLTELANKESRVRYFVNDENAGACVSRNKAIFSAQGQFITGLDDDDFFLPNRIGLFVSRWPSRNKNAVALFSNAWVNGTNSKVTQTKRQKIVHRNCLFEMNHIGNQVYLPTETIRSIGGFDESLPAWQDYDCWLRLFRREEDSIELVEAPSYVVDMSHDQPRISTSSKERKFKAFKVITEKLDVTGGAWASMKVVLCDAAEVAPPLSIVTSKIIFSKSVKNVTLALKVVAKALVYRWPPEASLHLD